MLLIEVQQYNLNCKLKTGCHQCLSIVSSGTEQRLSIANTKIFRQYKRKRKNEREKIQHYKNCKLLTDKMSSYLEDDKEKFERKRPKVCRIKRENKDKTRFFPNFSNKSFSIFFNYLLNYKTPSTSAHSTFKSIDFKSSKKFKFRFKSFQTICLILIGFLNCVLANSFNLIDSPNSISTTSNFPYSNLSLPNLNLSTYSKTYSSLNFMKNFLPSTKSFNYFYSSLSDDSFDRSTTRPLDFKFNFSLLEPNLIEQNDTKKFNTQSSQNKEISNAFPINFNQFSTNFSINNNKPNRSNKFNFLSKWPYGSIFKIKETNLKKFNWTIDRFKKSVANQDRSSSSSTESVRKFANNLDKGLSDSYYSASSDYDSNFSSNPLPTPSGLISNQSNKTSITNSNDKNFTISKDFNDLDKNLTDFIDFSNSTDSNGSFMEGFIQPFTNISWWFKIPFPRSGYHNYSIVLLAIFITIVMMLVVIGNLLVCIAICTEKSLKTIQNWFIASLAVSDLLLGLIIMPFSLAYELMGTWVFSNAWCDFHHALDVLLTTASINNLCLISLDRYWSVTQAIEYLKKRTPCRAIFMIVFAWVFSACVCLPPLIGWKKDNQDPGECQLSNDLGYVLYSSLGSFYIPSIVMIFVYAKIFVAARSRARKHVRKKQQISGGSSAQEQKKTQVSKQISQPPVSTSSQDNSAFNNRPVTSASPIANQQAQHVIADDKKVEMTSADLKKSESKGSIKAQSSRAHYGRFTRRAQLTINNDQELEESSEIDANQTTNDQKQNQQIQQESTNVHTASNQTTNTESSSGIGTAEEQQLNSVPTSGSSAQTEPADLKTDSKGSNFTCARSTSAFTYDHLFVEDRKTVSGNAQDEKIETADRPATPSSKVTFSPNDIVFDLNANGTQSVSMVPQIVIHGSMQQLHLQTNVKRARFSINKIKDSDFNNNSQSGEKRFGHPTITGTLSAGQLDCVILDHKDGSNIRDISSTSPIGSSGQSKRSSIKRSKYQNELEIDCKAAQQLNQQQNVGSPHSILKPSSNSSTTALLKSTINSEKQMELQEKSPSNSVAQHQPIKQMESNLSTASSNIHKEEKQAADNHVSPVSRTFSEQTANSTRMTQEGRLNYLGVNSLQQSAASISGSMMSINYDDDSECYADDKGSKRGFEDDDEFDFDDENESSNTHDENASKRSVKSNLRQSKKGNIFTRWSWCKKWLWLNEKCASNQEEEFAGYEEDDEEEDEEYDEVGRSSLRSSGEHQSVKKGVGKRILRKNRNKNYSASIISANNTSSSGTHSGTAQTGERGKSSEKKSNSLFSRFSRDNSNKSTSSGSAKRNGSSNKQRSSAKSSCSVAAISQSSRQRKHRHKSSGSQLHAHSSSTTAQSEQSAAATTGQYRFASEADRQKRRIAKAREKRATLILGLIMGAFILGYIPFSTMYLIQGICPDCQINSALTITYWIGYTASAINPIIYTVFNRDFRKAFRKILFR